VLLRLRLWRCAARAGVSVRACCGVVCMVWCVCVWWACCAPGAPRVSVRRLTAWCQRAEGTEPKHTPKQNKQTNTKQKHTQRGGRPLTVIGWHDTCIVALSGWLLAQLESGLGSEQKLGIIIASDSCAAVCSGFAASKNIVPTSIGSGNVPPHHTLAHTACTHVGPMEERLATTCVCRRGSEGTDLAGHHQPTTEPLDAYFFEK
jgi:hypothetical protein